MQACWKCGDKIKYPRECLYCHDEMENQAIVKESIKRAVIRRNKKVMRKKRLQSTGNM